MTKAIDVTFEAEAVTYAACALSRLTGGQIS